MANRRSLFKHVKLKCFTLNHSLGQKSILSFWNNLRDKFNGNKLEDSELTSINKQKGKKSAHEQLIK